MGTLGMAWGSGSANFPFLVTPAAAIQNYVLSHGGGSVQTVLDNNATSQIASVAAQATVALVFVNADSGEGYIQVDGNLGDRNNLTLWQGGDELVAQVASICNNTIVVIHSTVSRAITSSM
jgi:beta-glucosidase